MSQRDPMRQRIDELLADRALFGVTDRKSRELSRFSKDFYGHEPAEFSEFDTTVAALDVALAARSTQTMPEHLKTKIRNASQTVAAFSKPPVDNVTRFEASARTGSSMSAKAGWLVAAAAMVLAALAWLGQPGSGRVDPAPAEPTVAELSRDLQQRPDTLEVSWNVTGDPASTQARGKVVWNESEQRGYMHIAGLESNDPTEFQYQLWIFDAARDERYPVDGGVFDVGTADEVIVPIDPKIEVDEATLFAVTVERPGGVVVSSRERIVLAAPVA